MKQDLIKFLKKNEELKDLDLDKLLDKPKITSHGDFTLPCFILSKQLNKSPQEITKELEETLNKSLPKFLEKIQSMGPFLNFYLNTTQEAEETLNSIQNKIFNFKSKNSQKILIEYPSPNTNKSLHLGHVRNMLIGNSLSKILKKTGNEIIKTNLNNDRGIALCKSMLGYELFHINDSPESLNLKSDEFVSMCYVRFGKEAEKNDSLNIQAQEMLVKWEAGDKKTLDLWDKILNWVFEGYKVTYNNYKLKEFDTQYFESKIYNEGKDIILNAIKNKVKGFDTEEDGAIFCDLTDKKLDKKYLLRKDGTALYMTQDLHLAYLKEKEFKADKYIFIVGQEQKYHFEVLFEILSRLDFGDTNKNYHFAYGYVYDKDGKKFSSRKGKTISADWLINEVITKAKENLLTKELTKNLDKNELEKRSKIIGYSALSFSMLKINPMDDIKFDIERALAFEGETGPYVQYTYARIMSILRKSNTKITTNIDYSIFSDIEKLLIKTLKEYPKILEEASTKYKISAIANYLIKLSQQFNEFYQNSNILKSNEKEKLAKLLLADSAAKIIKEGLELLDIEVLEEM